MHFLVRSSLLVLGLGFASTSATAQTTFAFTLDQPNSNFTFSGTSTFGPITGNPSNMFQLLGPQNLDLTFQSGSQPFASVAFSGGMVATNTALHGKIRGGPFGSNYATVDVTGLVMSATSATTSVGAGGAFTANVILTALSGNLHVAPLIGSPSDTDLTGMMSNPTSVAGNLTLLGNDFHLVAPVNTTFPFMDTSTGISGSITLTGTITANFAFIRTFCYGDGSGTACPCANNSAAGNNAGCLNSTGVGAKLQTTGLPSLTADTLALNGTQQPATTVGLYFQGNSQVSAGSGGVFGDGLRCVTTSVIRLGTKTASGGASSYPTGADPTVSVKGNVTTPAVTRYYQLWYRNAAMFCNAETFNLSNGASVVWMP